MEPEKNTTKQTNSVENEAIEQSTQIPSYQTASAGVATMPGIMTLITDSIAFVSSRLSLVLAYLAVNVLAMLLIGLGSLALLFVESLSIAISYSVFTLATIAMIVVSIFNAGAVLYASTSSSTTTYKEGLLWVKRNFWSYLWIQALIGLVVFGGMALLIIPGIILAVYLAFSQIVLMHENLTGTKAMNRSWQLVKDAWFPVAGRLVVFLVIFLLIGSLVSVLDQWNEIVAGVVQWVVSGFTTVLFVYVLGRMYHARAQSVPVAETGGSTALYWTFGIIGILAPFILMLIIAVAISQGLIQPTVY